MTSADACADCDRSARLSASNATALKLLRLRADKGQSSFTGSAWIFSVAEVDLDALTRTPRIRDDVRTVVIAVHDGTAGAAVGVEVFVVGIEFDFAVVRD